METAVATTLSTLPFPQHVPPKTPIQLNTFPFKGVRSLPPKAPRMLPAATPVARRTPLVGEDLTPAARVLPSGHTSRLSKRLKVGRFGKPPAYECK